MKLLFPAFLMIVFSSCLNDPECLVTATTEIKISFFIGKSDTLITIDKVTATGTDSVFYSGVDPTAQFVLPVNPRQSATTFRFYHDAVVDSLQVGYRAENTIISPACGAFINYKDLTVNATSFPTVQIVANQLTTSVTSNIEVKY